MVVKKNTVNNEASTPIPTSLQQCLTFKKSNPIINSDKIKQHLWIKPFV